MNDTTDGGGDDSDNSHGDGDGDINDYYDDDDDGEWRRSKWQKHFRFQCKNITKNKNKISDVHYFAVSRRKEKKKKEESLTRITHTN